MKNDHAVLWEQFEKAVNLARKQGRFNRASRILKDALREAEEYGDVPIALVDSACSLAEIYINQHRFSEAETLYRAVLELREKLLGPTHQEVVETLKKLAVVQILGFRAEALGKQILPNFNWKSDGVAAAS